MKNGKKRTIALFAAALMALSSCGTAEDDSSAAVTEKESSSAAEVQEAGTEEANSGEEPEQEDSEQEQTSAQTGNYTPDPSDTEDIKFWKNIILDLNYASGYQPTPPELEAICENLKTQFNAAYAEDADAYWDAINMSGIVTADYWEKYINQDVLDSGDVGDAQLGVIAYLIFGIMDIAGDVNDNSLIEPGFGATAEKLVKEATDEQKMTIIEGSMWENLRDEDVSEYGDLTLGDDLVYYIELDKCEKVDGVLYLEMDFGIFCGEYNYGLSEVCAWAKDDGTVGAFAPDLYLNTIADNHPDMAGKSGAEIMDIARGEAQEYSEILPAQNNMATAKSAFNALAEYLADQETMGRLPEQVFADGDFVKANSDKGLDLSTEYTQSLGDGDKFILDQMRDMDYTEGYVYVGLSDDSDVEFFAQYKTDDDRVGQYPYYTDDEGKAASAQWGKLTR